MTLDHDLRHHHTAELLEDYALGSLSADVAAWAKEHLDACPACQHALMSLMGAVQYLPYVVPEPRIPPMRDDLWDRIEQSISRPETDAPATAPELPPANVRSLPPRRLRSRQWLGIAALMVLSLIGGALLSQVLSWFGEEPIEAQVIAIEFTDPTITATGFLRYLPDQQVFLLEVEGLTPPPEGFVHQAWLIDDAGPVPAGLMDTTRGELATIGTPDQYQTFAITLEPGPLGNEAPTSDPILVASLEDIARNP